MSHPISLPAFGPYTIPRGDAERRESRIAAHLAWCEKLHRARLAGRNEALAAEVAPPARPAPASAPRLAGAELVGVALLLTSVLLAFVLASFDPRAAAPAAQTAPQARAAAVAGAPA